jgi:DNA polymerase
MDSRKSNRLDRAAKIAANLGCAGHNPATDANDWTPLFTPLPGWLDAARAILELPPPPATRSRGNPDHAVSGELPKPASVIDRIRDLWSDCDRCALARCGRSNVVVGTGPAPARLMVIGEAPGEQEDHRGEPFVGPAGQLFNRALEEVGIDRGELFTTNIVACRPPDNRVPMFDEISKCRSRLEQLIGAVRPKVILVMGAVALTPVTGKQGITKHRGKWCISVWEWRRERVAIDTLPTFHPAGLLPGRLRDPADLELFKRDLRDAYDRASDGR